MPGGDIDESLARMKSDATLSDRVLEPMDTEVRLAVALQEDFDLTLTQLGEYAHKLRDAHVEDVTAAGPATCPTACDKRIEPR